MSQLTTEQRLDYELVRNAAMYDVLANTTDLGSDYIPTLPSIEDAFKNGFDPETVSTNISTIGCAGYINLFHDFVADGMENPVISGLWCESAERRINMAVATQEISLEEGEKLKEIFCNPENAQKHMDELRTSMQYSLDLSIYEDLGLYDPNLNELKSDISEEEWYQMILKNKPKKDLINYSADELIFYSCIESKLIQLKLANTWEDITKIVGDFFDGDTSNINDTVKDNFGNAGSSDNNTTPEDVDSGAGLDGDGDTMGDDTGSPSGTSGSDVTPEDVGFRRRS